MTTNEALKQFVNKDFLVQFYQFSYKRCNPSIAIAFPSNTNSEMIFYGCDGIKNNYS